MVAVQFIKFLLVGVLNTLFSYVIYAFFLWVGAHYSVAVLLAAVIGALFNFKTIGSLVFGSRGKGLLWRFLAVYLTVYLLNVGSLKLCKSAGLNMYGAGFVVAVPMAIVSFLLLRQFVFSAYAVPAEGPKEPECPQH